MSQYLHQYFARWVSTEHTATENTCESKSICIYFGWWSCPISYFHSHGLSVPGFDLPILEFRTSFHFVLQLQMSVPNHGSQAGQNTAGRIMLNRKGDPIRSGCLMCMFLSVNIPQQRANG
ncbi:hypothetical protein CIB84_009897 [Bambusicola thoracicus]|uniref:Uncharacterized protein n=1 Tax=Bambusicola thoracicus TaxID=9083 RepID=A0A2P4SQH3_BAMTH|nr:hypothetical protein CIB84_009897 [Bambusicola thoracicus]